jgi:hypothetical protein
MMIAAILFIEPYNISLCVIRMVDVSSMVEKPPFQYDM